LDPPSPSADKKSVFSFYIQEPSDINPFNPSHASTLRKTHHVSMPTLSSRPRPAGLQNRHSLDDLHKPFQQLRKEPSLRPFLIRVQSRAGGVDTDTETAFTRPRGGRRISDIESKGYGKKKRGQTFRFKTGFVSFKLNFFRGSERKSRDIEEERRRCYYFI
jgi:hypothetical protein